MKRIVCVLCILFVLCIPASAMPPRPVADFAEMVIVGAEIAPDGTWIVHANHTYDYYIMATGQFDFIEQWWLGMYHSRPTPRNCYLPVLASSHANGVYIWDRPGWKGITWFVPNTCRLDIQMVTETPFGVKRVVTDQLNIIVLPAVD
jgi:hypothetical protein